MRQSRFERSASTEKNAAPPRPAFRPQLLVLLLIAASSVAATGQSETDYPGAIWIKSPYYYAGRRVGSVEYTIEYIVIHATDGDTAESQVRDFLHPEVQKSAHYLIANGEGTSYKDGQIIQMVREADTAYSIAIWPRDSTGRHRGPIHHFNTVNIELVGRPDETGWCTEAMYRSAAKLVRSIADRYGIPLTRTHILGHDEVARTSVPPITNKRDPCGATPGHCTFDWDHFMALIGQSAVTALTPVAPVPPLSPVQVPSPSLSPAHDGSAAATSEWVWPIVLAGVLAAGLALLLMGILRGK